MDDPPSVNPTRGHGSHCAALPSVSRTADCPRLPLKRLVPLSLRQVPALTCCDNNDINKIYRKNISKRREANEKKINKRKNTKQEEE